MEPAFKVLSTPDTSVGHANRCVDVSCQCVDVSMCRCGKRTGSPAPVDLAGSERCSKTGVAGGVRFEEMTCINLSLTTLARVIDALVWRAPFHPQFTPARCGSAATACAGSKGAKLFKQTSQTRCCCKTRTYAKRQGFQQKTRFFDIFF